MCGALELERNPAADHEVVLVRSTGPGFFVPNARLDFDQRHGTAPGSAGGVVEDPQTVEVERSDRFARESHYDLAGPPEGGSHASSVRHQ
jgi:hypothetical protein